MRKVHARLNAAHPTPCKMVRGSVVVWFTNAVFAAGAVACYASYRLDGSVLRAKAMELAGVESCNDHRVLALTDWIHGNLPTARNERYFVFPGLRATPLQVLDGGGDCADKSRLLAAMLRQIGIPATMALCFDPETRQPSHTVVEARVDPDDFMLVDPAYDLYYPKPERGYYGIAELRQNPSLLQQRLEYVWRVQTRPQASHSYDPNVASFVGLSTFNWNKNAMTRLLRDVLFLAIGPEVYRLPRPRPLEAPKLAVALALAVVAVSMWAARLAVRHLTHACHLEKMLAMAQANHAPNRHPWRPVGSAIRSDLSDVPIARS